MDFSTFKTNLGTLVKAVKITTPATVQINRFFWGAPTQAVTDLPAVIGALTESERTLGFGSREQMVRINLQVMVAKASPDNTKNADIATALWFAFKDTFDKSATVNGAVAWSTLRGGDPTVPVILTHAGQAYIGFNSYLDIQDYEGFDFGGS
ncbi:MAG: hypothetical protein PHQ10_06910 [Dehalococcoidales bacterium]|jgi:hypothetical protein|nr:hypothetical protein [Dehalococcoidales bacterium]MDD5498626.1 hypothetical protein [Dehalococcoidales bacterium]MDX9803929.1 hypothetical protein [Dehalococcoidales bacterium]